MAQKPQAYIIAEAPTIGRLEAEVNRLLGLGYVPIGGLTQAEYAGPCERFRQAMYNATIATEVQKNRV